MKKILLVVLVAFSFMFMTTNVNAEENSVISDEFNKIAPNGVLNLNMTKSTWSDVENEDVLSNTVTTLLKSDSYYLLLSNCNSDKTECDLGMRNNGNGSTETHKIKLIYQEENQEIKNVINQYAKSFDKQINVGGIDNISAIKSYNLNVYDLWKAYTEQEVQNIKNQMNNEHIKVELVNVDQGGGPNFIYNYYQDLIFYYDNVVYKRLRVISKFENIIYIPYSTENTKDAYMNAAQKILNDKFGNNVVKISGATAINGSDYEENEDLKKFSRSLTGDYYYTITIGNFQENFLIVRENNKEMTDTNTNIVVSTDSSNIPDDTTIKVTVVERLSQVFEDIKNILKINDNEEVQVYDIKLFSQTTNGYITKINNGYFKVSIPIKECLRGKKLVAYYINNNGRIERHPITVESGIGTFTTNHFSIYTIAEERQIEEVTPTKLSNNAQTSSMNIVFYVVTAIGSLIGITYILIKKKKIA